jgi:hypothetical protein
MAGTDQDRFRSATYPSKQYGLSANRIQLVLDRHFATFDIEGQGPA